MCELRLESGRALDTDGKGQAVSSICKVTAVRYSAPLLSVLIHGGL